MRRRVLVTGAGGAAATNFVRSLRAAPEEIYLIGADCDPYHLQRAETDERHLVPPADDADYLAVLEDLISETGAELIHCQPDQEVRRVSAHRDQLPIRTFLPSHLAIELCQDKFESYRVWRAAGLPVPETMRIAEPADLAEAFARFGHPLWLRAVVSPGGGKGALRTEDPVFARAWLDFCHGWNEFVAAECLESESVTWTALYRDGELIVAQGRRRLYWELGNRAPSGVTGVTGAGETVADPQVDEIGMAAIAAVDPRPNGIYGVDLTYDRQGRPNPTEINIGRFFTTHFFFTCAGLNLPWLFVKLAFDEPIPELPRKLNPLPDDLLWIRGVDVFPRLTTSSVVAEARSGLERRRARLASR